MAQVVSVQASQRFTRLVGRTRLSRLRLRDPGLGDLRLRPAAPSELFDVPVGVALVEQTARHVIAISQRRSEQLGAMPGGRTARDPLKAFEQPHPFRLMPRLNTDRLYSRPILLKIFAENLTSRIVQIRDEETVQFAGAILK
jgi:hypothetical protein